MDSKGAPHWCVRQGLPFLCLQSLLLLGLCTQWPKCPEWIPLGESRELLERQQGADLHKHQRALGISPPSFSVLKQKSLMIYSRKCL